MNATAGDRIARLRVAIETERLPRDLGEELLELLTCGETGKRGGLRRTARRNALLREAAGLLSGSLWAKATRLHEELTATEPRPDSDGVRALMLEAAAADRWCPCPTSIRQLHRILAESD